MGEELIATMTCIPYELLMLSCKVHCFCSFGKNFQKSPDDFVLQFYVKFSSSVIMQSLHVHVILINYLHKEVKTCHARSVIIYTSVLLSDLRKKLFVPQILPKMRDAIM